MREKLRVTERSTRIGKHRRITYCSIRPKHKREPPPRGTILYALVRVMEYKVPSTSSSLNVALAQYSACSPRSHQKREFSALQIPFPHTFKYAFHDCFPDRSCCDRRQQRCAAPAHRRLPSPCSLSDGQPGRLLVSRLLRLLVDLGMRL